MSAAASALRAALSFGIGFAAVIWLATAPLEALAEGLDQELERFVRGVPYADDRTLVLLRREGSPA